MGHRRRELVLLLAALAGIAIPPASASANPVLAHITRTVTGESALLHLDPSNPGVDVRATQILRELMRDATTGRSVSPTPELVRLLAERPRLPARVGCFPNAAFFHVDVGRTRGIWFDVTVGVD